MPNSFSLWWVLACIAGTVIGAVLFFNGFRMLRFKRMILNTPLSRIHSASIGLVEVTGTPVGPYVLSAPITGDPCYYYRVRAWQWVESENSHQWKSVLDESLHVPFFLEDSTGRVLVDPQGADLDVHRSFSDEIGASFFRTPGLVPPNVLKFLATRGLVPAEKIKLEERTIPQGFPLFVFGTLGENAARNQQVVETSINSGKVSFTSSAASPSSLGFNFQANLNVNVPTRMASTAVEVLNHIPGVHVETTETQIPNAATSAVLPNRCAVPPSHAGFSLPPNVSASSLKPSSDKSAFGDFDPHPSVAISKGERNEPFAISGHSQRELVGKLAWKSALFIWGGPVLTIACLYILLAFWGFVSP
jgi:E3 Ubiquitin ligase